MSRPRLWILTPPGRAAVAGACVAGEGSLALVRSLFRPAGAASPAAGGHPPVRWGRIALAGEAVDEVLLVERAGDRVEIFGHGGERALARLVSALEAAGAARAPEGEAPPPLADLPGRVAREAEALLPSALTGRAAAMLLAQRAGALSGWARPFAGGAAPSARLAREAEAMRARASYGEALVSPPLVAIAGPPNAGKSTLLNRLAGEARAVASSEAGTTRDPVEAILQVSGVPVRLVDTAGLGPSRGALDAEGQARARERIAQAAAAVAVLDATAGDPRGALAEWAPRLPARTVWVWNKADLAPAAPGEPWIAASALTGEGIGALTEALLSALVGSLPPLDAPCPFLPRHRSLLDAAILAAERGDDASARAALNDLAGGEASKPETGGSKSA